MAAPSGSRAGDPFTGGEYEVVTLQAAWGVVSLLCGLGALLSRPLVRLLPALGWQPSNPWIWPLLIAVTPVGFGLIGLILGLIGLRRSAGTVTARLGVLVNGAVVGLTALLALVFAIGRLFR